MDCVKGDWNVEYDHADYVDNDHSLDQWYNNDTTTLLTKTKIKMAKLATLPIASMVTFNEVNDDNKNEYGHADNGNDKGDEASNESGHSKKIDNKDTTTTKKLAPTIVRQQRHSRQN